MSPHNQTNFLTYQTYETFANVLLVIANRKASLKMFKTEKEGVLREKSPVSYRLG